jgi:hypothetical protein
MICKWRLTSACHADSTNHIEPFCNWIIILAAHLEILEQWWCNSQKFFEIFIVQTLFFIHRNLTCIEACIAFFFIKRPGISIGFSKASGLNWNSMLKCARNLRLLAWLTHAHSSLHWFILCRNHAAFSDTLTGHHSSLRNLRTYGCRHLGAIMQIRLRVISNSIRIGFYCVSTNWLAQSLIVILRVRR